MKTQDAVIKLQEKGFSVQLLGNLWKFNRYMATKKGHQYFIELVTQTEPVEPDDELIIVDLKRKGEEDDPANGYYQTGTICDNLEQALRIGNF